MLISMKSGWSSRGVKGAGVGLVTGRPYLWVPNVVLTSATLGCPIEYRASDPTIGLLWLAKVYFRLISARNYTLACHDRCTTSISLVGPGQIMLVGLRVNECFLSPFSGEILSSSCQELRLSSRSAALLVHGMTRAFFTLPRRQHPPTFAF